MMAGNLDSRVTLFEPALGVDSIGSPLITWTDRGSVAASAKPISDGERRTNSEVMAVQTHRFQIRYSALTNQVNAKWELEFDGRRFGIVGKKEIGRRVGFEITASARAD